MPKKVKETGKEEEEEKREREEKNREGERGTKGNNISSTYFCFRTLLKHCICLKEQMRYHLLEKVALEALTINIL